MRKLLINLFIALGIGAIFIVLMFTDKSVDKALDIFKTIDYLYLLIALLCVLALWILGSISVKVLKKSMIGEEKDPGGNFLAVLSHDFISAITPFSSGGQPALVYTLTKKGLDTGIGTSLAIIRSFLYMVLELALSLIGFFIAKNYLLRKIPAFYAYFIPAVVVCTLYLGVIIAFLSTGKLSKWTVKLVMKLVKKFVPKKYDKIEKYTQEAFVSFRKGVEVFAKKPWYWLFAIVLQTAELICIYIVPVFMLRAIEGSFEHGFTLLVCAILTSMMTSYVPTPGTAGGAEGIALLLIAPFFTTSPALSVIFIWRLISYYSKILFGSLGFMAVIKMPYAQGSENKATRQALMEEANKMW